MGNNSVLVVDDEKGIRRFLFESLELQGYKVETAESYESAEKLIYQKQFETVLLDLRLRDRDSLSLIEKIKDLYPNVNIIMMSAYGTIDIAVKALKYGASEFLEKPFSIDKLIKVIKNHECKKEKIFVGNYILENKIGEGGTSIVYKAKHRSLLRDSAVKILKDTISEDSTFLARFMKEARLTASLHHKNIVNIYDYGKCKSGYYIAMEYIDGKSLNNLVADNKISLLVAVSICSIICRTLDHAHKKGIIHRDLKLENILISERGVKLVDFGLAKTYHGNGLNITQPNKIVGTPLYMSPEQVEGKKVTIKSDIFSVGVILYKIITGNYPFYNENNMVLMKMISLGKFRKPSDYFKDFDKKLEKIILKALNHKPIDRFSNVSAMADKLDEWLRKNGVADPEAVVDRFYRHRKYGLKVKKIHKVYNQNNNSFKRVKEILLPFLTILRYFPNGKEEEV